VEKSQTFMSLISSKISGKAPKDRALAAIIGALSSPNIKAIFEMIGVNMKPIP
jgi:hypothetical protein